MLLNKHILALIIYILDDMIYSKVKMQVTLPGQEGGIPRTLIAGMRAMHVNRAETKFPFGSLNPLWGRQVPYTMIKFVNF